MPVSVLRGPHPAWAGLATRNAKNPDRDHRQHADDNQHPRPGSLRTLLAFSFLTLQLRALFALLTPGVPGDFRGFSHCPRRNSRRARHATPQTTSSGVWRGVWLVLRVTANSFPAIAAIADSNRTV